MNALPRFDQIELGAPAAAADGTAKFDDLLAQSGPEEWLTPEQIREALEAAVRDHAVTEDSVDAEEVAS